MQMPDDRGDSAVSRATRSSLNLYKLRMHRRSLAGCTHRLFTQKNPRQTKYRENFGPARTHPSEKPRDELYFSLYPEKSF